MTNEEKIKEILHDHKNDTRWFMLEEGASEYLALREMAEWKDQHFKKYLEEKQSLLKSTLEIYQDNKTMHYFSPRKQKTICRNLELKLSLINEIINELFREEKNENY